MRKTLLILILCFPFVFATSAQNFWNKSFGGATIDEALDIASDASGNLYVAGYFSNVVNIGGATLTASGATDILLVKMNAQGAVLWARKAGGNGADRALAVCADDQGNVCITGTFHGNASFGALTVSAVGTEEDAFIAKYDASGNVLWAHSGGGPDADIGNAVAFDNAGNVIVTGQFKMTAQFDALSITAMNNPLGQSSIDVFTAKYNLAGNLLWLKKGSAEQTDRGIDVTTDDNGNVYVTGMFSDTITFDSQHNNVMYNSIFLIKYNAAGQELWFRKIGGGQYNAVYGIATNQSNIYICGDFSSNMVFFGSPNHSLSCGNNQNIFVAKYDLAGNYIWSSADSSDNQVHVRNITADASGNTFLVGDFKCIFTEMSMTYGNGTFNSAGFDDIFVMQYNNLGERQWARQFAGRGKDNGFGVALSGNQPKIAGSFKGTINFPSGSNWQAGTINPYSAASQFFCMDPYYSTYHTSVTNGEEDLFVASPADLTRQPYDYYYRSGAGCVKNIVECCIANDSIYETTCGGDTISGCGRVLLSAHARTNSLSPKHHVGMGPDYRYVWSNGDTTRSITVLISGYYSATVTTVDGCYISADTVWAEVYPMPTVPNITDDHGFNFHAINTHAIDMCYPDSALITAGNIGNNLICWTGPGIPGSYYDTSVVVSQTGDYHATVTNVYGCHVENVVTVHVYDTFQPIIPVVVFPGDLDHNDSITLCQSDHISVVCHDSLQPVVLCIGAITQWYVNQVYYSTGNVSCTNYNPNSTGWYHFYAIMKRINLCDTIIDTAFSDIYIIVNPDTTIYLSVTGNNYFCPGGSVTLVVQGAQSYDWSLNGVHVGGMDTLVVSTQTNYYIEGSSTNAYGCTVGAHVSGVVAFQPAPVAATFPLTGLICPDDSVYVHTNGSGQFEWFGPDGLPVGTTQGIWVNTPGYYYCIVTFPNGCILTTNFVEVVQYATPFLEASPSETLCPGETVYINVTTNIGSMVQWLPPLSGNSLSVAVTQPGTYTCNILSCGILTQASITISLSTPISVISINGNDTVCTGDTIVLVGNPGMADYEWQPGGIHASTLEVTQSGTYWLNTSSIEGCIASSIPVSVYFLPYSENPPMVTATEVCYGHQTIATAAPASMNYYWYDNPGNPPVYYGNPYTTPVLDSTQTFWINSGQGQCPYPPSPFEVSVYEQPLFVILIVGNDSICDGDTSYLLAPINMGSYLWQPGGETSPAIEVTASGNYSVMITDSYGCLSDDTATITVVPQFPQPILLSDSTLCYGQQALLSMSPSNLNYSWYEMPGMIPLYNGNPYVTPVLFATQTYWVIADNGYCYSAMFPIQIEVQHCTLQQPSNVITPNGDGFNDYFKPDIFGELRIQCIIYDRWGEKIYGWDEADGKWEGRNFKGEAVSEGVYFYVVEVVEMDGNNSTRSGFIQVMR